MTQEVKEGVAKLREEVARVSKCEVIEEAMHKCWTDRSHRAKREH